MKRIFFAFLISAGVTFAQDATPVEPVTPPSQPAEAGVTPEPKKEEAVSEKKAEAPKDKPAQATPLKAVKAVPAAKSPVVILKIHEVRTDGSTKMGGNKALEFEQQYWMHGAVTEEQKEAKRGHYFIVSWENNGGPLSVEARFEYRQVGSKEQIRVLKLNYPQAQGTERSIFNVVGRAYKEYGAIQSWRLSFWSGDRLLAERQSFIW